MSELKNDPDRNRQNGGEETGEGRPSVSPPSMPYGSYPAYAPYVRKEQDDILAHTSTRPAFVAVLLCWAFGILFSEIFMRGGFGLSVPLLVSLFYCIAFWYFSQKEQMPPKSSFLLLLPVFLLSLGYFLSDNGMVYLVNTLLLLVLIPLQLCLMSRTTPGPAFSFQAVHDTLVSTLARPLSYLDAPFKALSRSSGQRKKGSKAAMVLLGLLIALPIAMIFTALFSQADDAFRYFLNRLSDSLNFSFNSVVFDLFFGTVAALFLSAWLITLRARSQPEKREFRQTLRLNGTLAATVLCVVNLIQIAFVVIQFRYLFAGAALPDGMNPAEYARSGFFELCGVLCFSVLILLLCMLFVNKPDGHRLPRPVRILLTVFVGCNYVIIASAVYRMLAYIGAFDLSVKRVMATWLIAVFALGMAGAALKLWAPKFHSFRYEAIVVLAMAIAVNLINVNAFVANYNVDRYLNSVAAGQTRTIDVAYLGSLGPSAAAATQKLSRSGDAGVQSAAVLALRTQKETLDQKSWKNSCLSDFEARPILNAIK